MKRNAPKLRFNGFEDEWTEKRLGEFIKERNEKTNDRLNYPLYSLTIENGVVPKSERYERDFLVKKEDNFKLVYNNDFAYNPMNLRFGALAIYNGNIKVSVSGYYNIFRFNNSNTSKFWINYLKTDRLMYLYNTIATGSLEEKKRVHFSQFKELNLKIPSLQEQEKIANFLTKVDSLIEEQDGKVTDLEKYKKGMMQKIFSQEIRFKDDNGCEYPEWEEKKLEQECVMFSGGTPSSKNKQYYIGTIPFIRSAEINSNITELKINNLALDNSSAKMVEKGDLLYALYGATSGAVGISKLNGAINQAVLCIRSNSIKIKYLFLLLQFNKKKIVDTYIQGGQGNLSASIIKELQYYFPCLAEQTKIANFLSNIDTIIEEEKGKLEDLRQWKKGLLQQMFV